MAQAACCPPRGGESAARVRQLRVEEVSCGDWTIRVVAGPMLKTVETRALCQSWLAPDEPWCVAGFGPPPDCPCGALNLCGVAAHVPEAVHGRSFFEATRRADGARVSLDALHALRGWAALSARRDALGCFATCDRSSFWTAAAREAEARLADGEDAAVKPAQAWD